MCENFALFSAFRAKYEPHPLTAWHTISFRCAPPAENQTAAPASKMRDLAYAFTTVNKLAWMQEVITLKASVMWIVGDDPPASSILASTCLTAEAGNCNLPSWPR